ncbi:MAG: STAS domain-containing protein [Ruminococcus sp.]|nr:STAS domain-containing protein [Ruminococcus sp.]
MNIKRIADGESLVIMIEGRIDTNTSPDFEKEIENLDGVSDLTLDFKDVAYISSAGLRVLLKAQKKMMVNGEMKLINVNDYVMDVLVVTGFSDILTIE